MAWHACRISPGPLNVPGMTIISASLRGFKSRPREKTVYAKATRKFEKEISIPCPDKVNRRQPGGGGQPDGPHTSRARQRRKRLLKKKSETPVGVARRGKMLQQFKRDEDARRLEVDRGG